MNKTLLISGIALSGLLLSLAAAADIYKHVDANGRVTYSNIPSKGATRLQLDPPNVASPPARVRTPTPANFPRIEREIQDQRDSKRKEILKNELEAEKKALEEAKQAYAEGAEKPEVYRTKDGKIFRNVAKFEEKMRQLQADVDAHEKNIQLLQKELDALK